MAEAECPPPVELVLISPGRRIRREVAAEALFPQLAATEASNALRKALSLARSALSALGEEAVGCCPPTVTASGPARRLQSTPRPTKDRCAVHLAFRLAASATKRSRPPSAKRGRCWRTSPLPTGRCGQGRPSKLYAMRLTCAWPGTVPKALAVRRLTASSRHGKPAFPTTPPARRRPPLWSGVCGSGPPLVGGGYVPALPRSSERAGLASVARPR